MWGGAAGATAVMHHNSLSSYYQQCKSGPARQRRTFAIIILYSYANNNNSMTLPAGPSLDAKAASLLTYFCSVLVEEDGPVDYRTVPLIAVVLRSVLL